MSDESDFTKLALEAFGWLASEYQFKAEKSYGMFGMQVVYRSSTLEIRIAHERGSIFIILKPVDAPEAAELSLPSLLKCIPGEDLAQLSGPVAPAAYQRALESYARRLKYHFPDLLEGDTTRWVELLETHLKIVKEEYFDLTGTALKREAFREMEKYIMEKKDPI